MKSEFYLRKVIELACENVSRGGGPFAAMVVRDGDIISVGTNRVTLDNDPTAHAEVNAIRKACQKLGVFNLSGCVLYSSCEPCPMCLAAIYWSHIDEVYFAADKNDAARAGFDDSYIYSEMSLEREKRQILCKRLLIDDYLAPFEDWDLKSDKLDY